MRKSYVRAPRNAARTIAPGMTHYTVSGDVVTLSSSSISSKPLSTAEHGAPKGQAFVDPQIVEMMKTIVAGRTDEALNEQFGISYNSWRKLVAGLPVRASLAERLTLRVQNIEARCDIRKG